jgi:CDP-2,3-bis-(O-geranylgeranyl)-sn-glycerol synthase
MLVCRETAMGALLAIAQLAYFMLPSYLANMSPVFARRLLPWFRTPVDFNVRLDNHTVFGPHKTWRGLLAGLVIGVVVAGLQRLLLPWLGWLSIYDYSQWHLLGGLLGLGALLGDIVKSFFKRRLNIRSGRPWVPFDEIDHPMGALALASLVFFPGWVEAGVIVLVTFVGHIAINVIGHTLRLKEVPW